MRLPTKTGSEKKVGSDEKARNTGILESPCYGGGGPRDPEQEPGMRRKEASPETIARQGLVS